MPVVERQLPELHVVLVRYLMSIQDQIFLASPMWMPRSVFESCTTTQGTCADSCELRSGRNPAISNLIRHWVCMVQSETRCARNVVDAE